MNVMQKNATKNEFILMEQWRHLNSHFLWLSKKIEDWLMEF